MHFSRAGGGRSAADQWAAGRERRREPDGGNSVQFRAGGAGLPGWTCRSVTVQPADREHHLHATRLPLEPGAELVHLGAARGRARTCSSTSPTSANRADDLILFANYNQALPNNAAGTIPLQDRRPIPSFSDITYAFNGGKSRYKALQAKVDWRVSRDVTLLSSLTLSVTKDNGGQSLETANGNNPTPQDFRNMGPDYGLSYYHQPYNSTTSFVWTLPFGHGKRWGSSASGLLDGFIGGWQLAGINSMFAGEPVTFSYTPGAAFVVSGIQQDFRGANSYRANVSCSNPYAQGGTQTIANWFDKSCVSVPTDPSQPFGNAQRNTVRGPNVLAVRSRGIETRPRRWSGAGRTAGRGLQSSESHELHDRRTGTAARTRSARSRRPTIRGSYSSESSCSGRVLGWRRAHSWCRASHLGTARRAPDADVDAVAIWLLVAGPCLREDAVDAFRDCDLIADGTRAHRPDVDLAQRLGRRPAIGRLKQPVAVSGGEEGIDGFRAEIGIREIYLLDVLARQDDVLKHRSPATRHLRGDRRRSGAGPTGERDPLDQAESAPARTADTRE